MTIQIPRFKLKYHSKFRYYIMEDQLNSGPKYILWQDDLYELMGNMALHLGNVKLQKIIREESKKGG